MTTERHWYPFTLRDRDGRAYRVSFFIGEEATWDQRFHDLDGREIPLDGLRLAQADLRYIQESCDGTVGAQVPRRSNLTRASGPTVRSSDARI
jgi:hypothetical protein